MTAAIGHPTLRLLSVRISNFWLGDLPPGKWHELTPQEIKRVLPAIDNFARLKQPIP